MAVVIERQKCEQCEMIVSLTKVDDANATSAAPACNCNRAGCDLATPSTPTPSTPTLPTSSHRLLVQHIQQQQIEKDEREKQRQIEKTKEKAIDIGRSEAEEKKEANKEDKNFIRSKVEENERGGERRRKLVGHLQSSPSSSSASGTIKLVCNRDGLLVPINRSRLLFSISNQEPCMRQFLALSPWRTFSRAS